MKYYNVMENFLLSLRIQGFFLFSNYDFRAIFTVHLSIFQVELLLILLDRTKILLDYSTLKEFGYFKH